MIGSDPTLLKQAIDLHLKGQLAQASELYHALLSRNPNNSDALHHLAILTKQQGHVSQGLAYLLKAIEVGQNSPNLYEYYSNCGVFYRALSQPLPAINCYQMALQLNSDAPDTRYNLANAIQQIGDHPLAIEHFQEVLRSAPQHQKAPLGIAISQLLCGQYQAGWRGYENRYRGSFDKPYALHPGHPEQCLPKPSTYLPTDLKHKHILLIPEQGIGDELFFLRYIGKLQGLGANIEYLPSPKLRPLMQRADEIPTTPPLTSPSDYDRYDYIIPVGELPQLTQMSSHHDIAPSISLTPLTQYRTQCQQKFATLRKPWIGITWRSGGNSCYKKNFSFTHLPDLFKGFTGTLFILQRGVTNQELAFLHSSPLPINNVAWMNEDLEWMLALLDLLDDYVTVSNTNLHLRAALHKEAKILQSKQVDFRWPNFQLHTPSPWFKNSQVFSQDNHGHWDQAIERLKNALKQYAVTE